MLSRLKKLKKIYLAGLFLLGLLFVFTMPSVAEAAISGTATSPVKDKGTAVNFTTFNWVATTPTGTSVSFEFRAGTDNTPDDGGWQAWASVVNGGNISAFSGNRYYQYRATLNSTDDTFIIVPSVTSVTVNVAPNFGTLGGTTAGNVGLRADTGSAGKAKNLDWSATTNATGQKVLFTIRAGDSQAELDASSCYGPSASGSCTSWWTNTGRYFFQINGQANSPNSVVSSIPSKRYIEILVRLESSGANTPVLNSVTLTYDSVDAPTSLTSHRADNGELITEWANGSVVSKANLRGAQNGDTLTPQFEVRADTTFTGTPATPTGVTATANNITYTGDGETWMNAQNLGTISGLSAGTYYYKVRIVDQAGRVSGWSDSYQTIKVDQSPPTGTITINNGATLTNNENVTVSVTASDSNSKLGKLFLSNDGTTWEDKTPASGFVGEATFSGNIPWTLTSGEDGTRNVYLRVVDNAGNLSGTWLQTTDADFNAGLTKTKIQIIDGSIRIADAPAAPATVTIGTQTWMAQNLNVGTMLASGTTNPTNNGVVEKWCYDNSTANCTTYGGLYSWDEMMGYTTTAGAQGICPIGFHIPTDAEWTTLTTFLGTDPGTKLKPGGSSGFEGLLAGSRYTDGTFNDLGPYGYFWSSSESSSSAWYRDLNSTITTVSRYADDKAYGFSVRCLRTEPPLTICPFDNLGTFESEIRDFGSQSTKVSKANFTADTPTGTTLFVSARAGNTATPDGTWTTYQTLTSGADIPADSVLNGKRYLQYKAVLENAGDCNQTPTLHDISFDSLNISDQIILDTQPPGDFGLVSPENNIWSATEPNPIFTWSASSGHDKYQLWIDGELNTDNIDAGVTSMTASAPLAEGSHTWLVKAVDAAENVTEALGGARNYGYDATPPPNVTGLSAPTGDATPNSIMVRWNAVTDVGSGVVGYTLERKRYDSATWDGPTYASYNLGTVTSYNDTGLDQGYRYNYRIKAYDSVNLSSPEYATVEGYTVDTLPPSDPSGVTAVATASGDTAGYEISLAWNPSTDNGSGLEKYKVWRRAATNDTREVNNSGQDITNTETQVWTLIGVVNGPGPIFANWLDNDTNNDATMDVKTVASPRLNDYTNYHYRVVAVDAAGNHSKIITVDPVLGLPDYTNYKSERTVDVTPPSTPGNVTVTPTGVDSLGGEPLTQAMEITWGAATDTRTPGRTPTGNGSGVKNYKLYQAKGDVNGPTEAYALIYTVSGTSYTKEGLAEDSYYYYRVRAVDNADNESTDSDEGGALTKNSQVPTTPSNVNVTAKSGDPNLDPEVGSKITITFNGSRIKGSGNRVDGYRIYRSTTNFTSQSQWTALAPVHTFNNLNIPAETQDGQRSYVDTVQSDATRYYYRVQAFGWNESNQSVETSPSLSSIQVDTLHAGWDITPDATAPAQPQEVKVKDIHGNDSLYRNIVTWAKVSDSDRNGADDFSHYEVWRYESLLGVVSAAKISGDSTYDDSGFNYFVDGINKSDGAKDYSYYVVAKDNAKTEFKYANGTVINAYSNSSGFSGVASINPSVSTPTVAGISHKDIGVSTATVEWSTNQPCDSLVEYRIKNSATVIASGKNRTNPVNAHSVKLVGLEKGKTYEYRIVSRNSLGNIDTAAAGSWREFTTADFTISTVNVTTTTTTATVKWQTNILADASVEYKEESATGAVQESQTAGDPRLAQSHEVVIKALKPDTNYTYKIRSVSADKYISETSFATFRTRPFDSAQFTINPNASNVAEQNITATSAKIVWETLVATTTWVDYGTRSGSYNQSAGDNKYNTVHVVELNNLTPGQVYYYRVRGIDSNNIEYTSKEFTFTAVLEPEISGLKISLIDSYTAVVTFNTNVDTEAAVTYGADGKSDLKAGTTEYKRNHSVVLENLEDGKTYGYFVEVRDKLNNSKRSATANFETPIDRTGAKVENLKIDILSMGESDETASVIISWVSSKPTTTKVEYDEGVTAGKLGKSTIEDDSFNTSHTVIIKELLPSTSYQFKIVGRDKRDNRTESQSYTFVTPSQEKSIFQLIVRSLEETFAWTKNLGSFVKNLREKVR